MSGAVAPGVERLGGVDGHGGGDQVLMAQARRIVETLAPLGAQDLGVHVRRRRAQSFAVEGRLHLLSSAVEILPRPEQFDVVVPHGADRGERGLGVASHLGAHRVELEANPARRAGGRLAEEWRAGKGRRGALEKGSTLHAGRYGRARHRETVAPAGPRG